MVIDYKKKYLKYKLKYLTLKTKNTLWGGENSNFIEGTTKKIAVATYNISFATQLNKLIGSEADFVNKCQQKYPKKGGLQCHKNAIKSITKEIVNHNIKFIGFQELANKASAKNLQKKISLVVDKDGKIWESQYLTYYTANTVPSRTTCLLSTWDSDYFGNRQLSKIFNLKDDNKDNRPCTIFLTTNTIIINAHFGWMENETDVKPYETIISTELDKMLGDTNENKKQMLTNIKYIIFVGDTNDMEGFINSVTPLVLSSSVFEFKLHNNLDKSNTVDKLGTCCWHEIEHKYYSEKRKPGDYAIIMGVQKECNKYIANNLNPEHLIIKTQLDDKELKSDHDFMITKIQQ
tara:strand:+ start:2039 stop:3082 length:1044 start_codon:yes stop_codon:yes gene_type:complete